MIKRILTSLGLTAAIFFGGLTQTACSPRQLDRAVALVTGLTPLVVSFHPPREAQVVLALAEAEKAIRLFRSNPTRDNLRNAIAVAQDLVDRGVLKTGDPAVDSRLGPAFSTFIFILNFIKPPVEMARLAAMNDGDVKVTISKDQAKEVDRLLDKAERQSKGLE